MKKLQTHSFLFCFVLFFALILKIERERGLKTEHLFNVE